MLNIIESETIRYKTDSGFWKHIKVSKENPRNFKLGDKFFWHWGGHSEVDVIDEYTSQREIDELNGNVEKQPDHIIDLTYTFWRCVRKVME